MSDDLEASVVSLFKEIQEAKFGNTDWFFLSNLAQNVALIRGFQYLLSLEDLNFTLFPHQEEAVLRILQSMSGSALIADEVGLGKTIIALTVMSELKVRDLVKSVLIIAPSSLVHQWHDELKEKFNVEMPIAATEKSYAWLNDNFITTTTMATRYPEKIIDRPWDMVILDEAHQIKNRQTKAWQALNQIQKKYMLMLTATPMENYLEDIYNLVTLLKPIFGSYKQFHKRFAIPNDKRGCKDPIELRHQLNQIMIRRKREEIKGIFFPERDSNTLLFDLSDLEQSFYKTVTDYVSTSYQELEDVDRADSEKLDEISKKYNLTSKRYFNRKIWLHKFTLMLLQRRICSSPVAVHATLEKMIESRNADAYDLDSIPVLQSFHDIAVQLAAGASTKVSHLKELLERVPNKCIIFTEFTDTLGYIASQLETDGFSFLSFSGELSSVQRHETIEKFRNEKNILLSSDAGSEGLNLQVADTLINFDIPWNPMRIEQRIGRIYRLTQAAEVIHIFNMASRGTIEQDVLDVLYKKIGVFSTILGDLSHILGSLVNPTGDGKGVQIEAEIMKFFVKYGHSEKLKNELETMIQPAVEHIENENQISRDVLDVESLVDRH
ncbi:MAG TPA: SNF2-related protein [Candidatus Lokiarchaeia archaeon]|nr:SNF2-related protein [Candidatus Lokiarchaeia archaeon]